MLHLEITREPIHIGDDVKISLTRVTGGRVWIGIEAPKGVPVDRARVRKSKIADGSYRRSRRRLSNSKEDQR